MEKIEEVQINLINENPYQTRTSFTDYSEDIKLNGLNNPIVVRPIEDKFQLLAGENRLKSVITLNQDTITCRIIDLNDKEAELFSFRDNELRKKLKPIDRARAIRNILENDSSSNFSEGETIAGEGKEEISVIVEESSTKIINNLNSLRGKTERKLQLDEEEEKLNLICLNIGLTPRSITDALSILTLPDTLLDNEQTQEALNTVVKVLKDINTKYKEALTREDKVNDEHHIESNQLKVINEKVEKYIIEKINSIDSTTLMMICNAIIITPTNSKLEIIKSKYDERNRSISNMIILINDNDNVDTMEKEDLTKQLINNFAIDGIKDMKLFLEYFSKIDYDLKTAVINGLNIKAAHLLWSIRDIEERTGLIKHIIDQKANIQVIKVNKYIKEKEEEKLHKIQEEELRREEKLEEERVKLDREREALKREKEEDKRNNEEILRKAKEKDEEREREAEREKRQKELKAKSDAANKLETERLQKEEEEKLIKEAEEEEKRKEEAVLREAKEKEEEKQRQIDEEERLNREAEEDKVREAKIKAREEEIIREELKARSEKLVKTLNNVLLSYTDIIDTYEDKEEIKDNLEKTIAILTGEK